jgi:hypothetical protein
MQQRRRVNQFDRHAGPDGTFGQRALRARGEEDQRRTHPLTPTTQKVLSDTEDEGRIYGERGGQLFFKRVQVTLDRRDYGL